MDIKSPTLKRGLKLLRLPDNYERSITFRELKESWHLQITATKGEDYAVLEFYFGVHCIGVMIDNRGKLSYRSPTPYPGCWHIENAKQFRQRIHSYIM